MAQYSPYLIPHPPYKTAAIPTMSTVTLIYDSFIVHLSITAVFVSLAQLLNPTGERFHPPLNPATFDQIVIGNWPRS